MAITISRTIWAGRSLCVLGVLAAIALITIITYVGFCRFGPNPFPTLAGPSLLARLAFLVAYAPVCVFVGIAVTRFWINRLRLVVAQTRVAQPHC